MDRYELSAWLNPGKSQGRPNEKPGLEAHRSKNGLPVCVLPSEAPVPDQPNLRSEPDRASHPQFHASKLSSVATEFEQERFQLSEPVLPELRLPVSLDLLDGVADRVPGPLAAVSQHDAL
jgi:hypothetical protein